MDFTNHALSTTGIKIVDATTSFTVPTADADKFPTANFIMTVWGSSYLRPRDDNNVEIIECARSGATITIVTRAMEGTTQVDHAAGSWCGVFLTAGILNDLRDLADASFLPDMATASGEYLTNNGTIPSWDDTVLTETNTKVSTNKTFTTPVINSATGVGVVQTAYCTTQLDVVNSIVVAKVVGTDLVVESGKVYKVHIVLYTTSGAGGGVKPSTGGGATTTTWLSQGIVYSGNAIVQNTRGTSRTGSLAGATAVTAAFIVIDAYFLVNVGGTLWVTFAQNASDAATSSVLVGSFITIQQLS